MAKGAAPGPGDLNSCPGIRTKQLCDLSETLYLCAALFIN